MYGLEKENQLVRSYFIFTDLPIHVEYAAGLLPLLNEGRVINFELSLKNPKNPKKVREVNGAYLVSKIKLTFATRDQKLGLTQYIELTPERKP